MQAALDNVPSPPAGQPPTYPDASGLWLVLGIALVPADCQTIAPTPIVPQWRRVLVFENTQPMSEDALKAAVRALYSNALGQATGSPVEAEEPTVTP